MSSLSWDDYDSEGTVATSTSVVKTNLQPLTIDRLVDKSVLHLQPDERAMLKTFNVQGLLQAEELNFGGPRLKVGDKSLIDGQSDLNQLVPFQYPWAWQKYLDGSANHWMPTEIQMTKDIALWRSNDLSEQERFIVESCLGYFASADSVVANNIVLGIYRHITSPEHRQYLLRQAYEEAIHQHAYQYCIQSIGLDEGKIFNAYREVPSMALKAAFSLELTREIADPSFVVSRSDINSIQIFLKNLIGYYIVTEGVFFYCGFPTILSMGRTNKMVGTAEQFQYILRDESMHLNFGIDTINQVILENPEAWTIEFRKQMRDHIVKGVILEKMFAVDILGQGILGLNVSMMHEYLEFCGNRRAISIGLDPIYPNAQNTMPWMSEMIDLRKEKNFFETRVTDYQVGANLWGG